MMQNVMRAIALAVMFALLPAVAAAAAKTAAPQALPTPRLPNTKLHTDFNVEVNKHGQVVRVKSGKSCPNYTFNAQTYGNVLQMWIRRPDGTALVGMYHVSYDYDPKTHVVGRHVSLVKAGGNWGNSQGAANNMVDIAKRDNLKAAKAQAAADAKSKKARESARNLPDIKAIIKKDVAKPKATPKP
ncbi:MAG TPA: hypothetical protein VIG51_06285 [Candidatus Baltobacteraceae bacterium]|jgi:hypothetical protein